MLLKETLLLRSDHRNITTYRNVTTELRLTGTLPDLRVRKVRVESVGEGPVKDVLIELQIPIEVRGGFHHPEHITSVWGPELTNRLTINL